MANTGLPVQTLSGTILATDGLRDGGSVNNIPVTPDIKNWFELYGERKEISFTAAATIANPAYPGQYVGGFTSLNLKEMVYVSAISISSSKPIEIDIAWNTSSNLNGKGSFFGGDFRTLIPAFAPIVIPINRIVYGDFMNIQVYVLEVYNADGTINTTNRSIRLVGAMSTITAYSDPNFTAKRKILTVGDSIAIGYTGASRKDLHWVWTTKRKFEVNTDAQIINLAQGGSNSKFVRDLISLGRLDAIKGVALLIENNGVNDPSTTDAEVNAYIDDLVTLKRKSHMDFLLLTGPGPVQDNTAHTNAERIRALKQAKVTSLSDPSIFFCNTGNSFPRATYSYYVATDVNGSAIHPGDTGCAAMTTYINNFMTVNNILI